MLKLSYRTILLLTLTIVGCGNFYFISAQEKVVSKCSESFDSYAKVYKECQRGDDLADLFVPTQVNVFNATNLEDEMARLDNFASNYFRSNDVPGFVVVYGGRANKFGEIEERSKRVFNYLTQHWGLPQERIILVDGGFREKFEFELWIGKTKDGFPPLSPTVKRENVTFKGKMKPLPTEIGFLD